MRTNYGGKRPFHSLFNLTGYKTQASTRLNDQLMQAKEKPGPKPHKTSDS